MTATKHGLDLPIRDDTTPGGGLVDDIKADLIALDQASPYYSEAEPDPSIVHNGFLWFNLTDSTWNYYHAPSLSWLLIDVGGEDGLAAHMASVPASHAADSITADHLAAGAVGSSELGPAAVIAGKIGVGGVSAANQLAAGVADDAAIGNRTVDQALAGGGNTGPLTSLASWFAKFIKQIKGTTNWYDTPATDLATAAVHLSASAPHGGHSTPASVAAAVSTHNSLSGAHTIYTLPGGGTPEGFVTAAVGSWYRDTATGKLWRKATGSGNTGWLREGTTIKSMQRGTISTSGTTATATITAVNMAKSNLVPLGVEYTNAGSNLHFPVRLEFTNSTTITAIRGGADGEIVVGFEVTEWED